MMTQNLIDELEREAAHADHMVGMAEYWMRRAKEAELTLTAVVHAAGSRVVIHSGHLRDLPSLELVRFEQAVDMTTHFVTRPRITS